MVIDNIIILDDKGGLEGSHPIFINLRKRLYKKMIGSEFDQLQ